jgi:hypothetical protein
VAARLRLLGDEHIRTLDSGAAQAERIVRTTLGDEAGSLLMALPPADRATAAYEMFQRIKDGRMNFDDASFWLSMRVRRSRQRLEQAANAGAAIKAERSRGGEASAATRRAPWKPWQEWIYKHPSRAHPNFQSDIIRVIQGRAGGRPIKETERVRNVPDDLPTIYGRNRKPPSEDSIRRNLFNSRVR